MSFWKNHGVPVLHGVLSHLISVLILAGIAAWAVLIAFFRNSAFSPVGVPLWLIVLSLMLCVFLLIRGFIRKRIKVRTARYGSLFAQVDVTDRVQSRIDRGILNVLATTQELLPGQADPFPNVTKALTIDYTLYGRDRTIQIIEGSSVTLP